MEPVVALAFYTKEQYELLLKVADDRKELHESWEEFVGGFIKAKTGLQAAGLEARDYKVDVQHMIQYFKLHKQKYTAKNRSAYVSEMSSREQ